jgi:oxygen-independent coproporphyrinogen-3 oxidase
MGEYQGLGCAAHSHRDGRRFWNLRTPDRYVDAVERGASVEAADERLDEDARALEALQLLLRTRAGVPAAALDPDELPGLVEPHPEDGDRLVLTVDGRLLANEVALRLRLP